MGWTGLVEQTLRYRHLTPIEVETLRAAFNQGMIIKEARKSIPGCTRYMATKYFAQFRRERDNIKNCARKPGSELTAREAAEVRKAWESGEQIEPVAKRLSISRGCVRNWYERFRLGEMHPNEPQAKSRLPQRHYIGNFEL